MVAIQVRDISVENRDALAAEAEHRGQSLQVFLHDIIEREAASARNIAWAREMAKQPRSPRSAVTSREFIDAAHRERDRAILDAVGLHDVPVFD
jgi:antitoxin FitA